MEIAYMSIYQGTDESDVVQIYNGILLNHKNNETPICSNMGGPKDCHTEWSKSDRERQISCDIGYMWNLEKMIQMIYI